MSDLSSLTKEQLIELLRQKENTEQLQSQGITAAAPESSVQPETQAEVESSTHVESESPVQPSICQYSSFRSNQGPCQEPVVTEWGFCKKHSKTVQARKAHGKYETRKTPPPQNVDLPPPKTVLETVSPPSQPINDVVHHSTVDRELNRIEEKDEVSEEKVDVIEKFSHTNAQNTKIRRHVNEQTSTTKPKKSKDKSKTIVKSPIAKRSPPLLTKPAKEKHTKSSPPPKVSSSPKKSEIPARKGVQMPVTKKKVIRPNYWGRFEDTETNILFDPTTKHAYGVQDSTGKILALTPKHISICEKNGWDYNKLEDEISEEEDEISEEEDEISEEDDDDDIFEEDDDDEEDIFEEDEDDDDEEDEDDDEEDDDDDTEEISDEEEDYDEVTDGEQFSE